MISYEISNEKLIDYVDTKITCSMDIYEIVNNNRLNINESRRFNDCFEGFFHYDLNTQKDLLFNIKLKNLNYQKNFIFLNTIHNNVEVLLSENVYNINNNNKLNLRINRYENTIISSINCSKRTRLIIKKYNPITNFVYNKTIDSNKIKILERNKSEIQSFRLENKELVLQTDFNFYDISNNFTFTNKVYDNLYRYYNSSNQIVCEVCYFDKDFCFDYYSNLINRLGKIIDFNNDTNVIINPFPLIPDSNKNDIDSGLEIIFNKNPINITYNPIHNNFDIIIDYMNKTFEGKKKKLEELLTEMNTENKFSNNHTLTLITISNLISSTVCIKDSFEQDCYKLLKESQKALIKEVAEILNCKNLPKLIFGEENPNEKIFIYSLLLYYTTFNYEYFDTEEMIKMKDISEWFVSNSTNVVKVISDKIEDKSKFEERKKDYLKIISSITSNLISISKVSSKQIIDILDHNDNNTDSDRFKKNIVFDDYKNASLFLVKENIDVKNILEKNTEMLIKLKYRNSENNSIEEKFDLKTDNYHFYSKRSIYIV